MLHVAMTGASGLIGSALVRRLTSDGNRVTRLVRHQPSRPEETFWDPAAGSLEPRSLEGVDAVIHLAGENVGARWTTARKERIRSSRVAGTRLLSQTLAGLQRPPQVLVSASAVGIYGSRGDEVLTETSPPGDPKDFLVSVAQDWENAAEPARVEGIRVVHPRFGVVLSPAGGALQRMLFPFRLGLGARLGDGNQWMSWVSIDDAVSAVLHALRDDRLRGAFNVTAPEPCTNRDFTRTLGRVLSRPALLAVPEAGLRLALGEMADGTILSSARVVPARLLKTGFHFGQPDLESALRHVLRKGGGDNFPS